jgi:hypothetical protein
MKIPCEYGETINLINNLNMKKGGVAGRILSRVSINL